ncbi:MAG TPA: PKD domain-containing protein [Candidatus Saccharimonadales bacterium]|nr:PKD domain-containing protein [Candidatus Saccharimonadales bacterium]
MNIFKKVLTRVRNMSAKQMVVAGVFALAVVGAAGAGIATKQTTAAAPDCTGNSIIYCGYSNPQDLINHINSQADLRDIYAKFGLSPSDYSRFVSSARPGVAMKDGTIVVDGRVVATGAWSLGRDANSHYTQHAFSIDGETLYESSDQTVFLSDSLPVYVLFNAQGVMQAAIMTPCGNPVTTFTPVTPNYDCNFLQMAKDDSKANSYVATSAIHMSDGVSLDHVTYNFGDGTTADAAKPTDAVKHTYTKAGNWTATVTDYFVLPGGTKVATAPAGNCVAHITVVNPFYTCSYLQTALVDESNKLAYKFTLKATAGNGASLVGADFDFGDGNKQTGAKPGTGNDALTIVTNHTYAKAGTYNVTPTLHFTTPTGDQTVVGTGACVGKVSPTLPPQPCQPGGTPAPGSAECSPKPCTPGGTPAPGSAQCTPVTPPATTLPNTGAGNVIGLFAGTSILGTAAHFVFQKRRLARAVSL